MAPAVVGAVGLVGTEVYRVFSPDAPLFADPPAESFLQAVQRGNQGMEEAYRFIAAGQDPNQPITVTDEDLTGGRTVRASPLLVAVAARNRNVVMMLLNVGARLDLPQNKPAVCLARALQNEEIASILERDALVTAPVPCPPRLVGATAPLVEAADEGTAR
jgi:hypothetical protein